MIVDGASCTPTARAHGVALQIVRSGVLRDDAEGIAYRPRGRSETRLTAVQMAEVASGPDLARDEMQR